MSLKEIRAVAEALMEKVEHLEEDALKNCNECDCPIKGDEVSVCGDCAAPDCAKCKAPIGSTAFCKNCGEQPRCNECDEFIASGACAHCHARFVSAAKCSTMDRYPVQGVAPVGDLQDQLLAFLVILAETCGCHGQSKRCVRCDDAMRLSGLYTKHLGKIRA